MIATCLRLNLGANDRTLPGFLSVDICPPADQLVNLAEYPWPWGDSTVEEVFAHDVFEHLPNKRETMNELWRILRPGGRADVCVPTIRGVGAVCDPTHVSYWSCGDFEYYEHGNYARERFRNSSYYGVRADFRIIGEPFQEMYRNKFNEEVWKVRITLEAVK